MSENIQLNNEKPSKFLSVLGKIWFYIKKAFEVLVKNWFFVLFPCRLFKELVYDKMRHEKQKLLIAWLFLAPTILGFLLFFAYPLLMSLFYAFSTVSNKGEFYLGQVFPKGERGYDFTATPVIDYFNNFKYALRVNEDFPVSLWTTIKDTVVDTAVITIFS